MSFTPEGRGLYLRSQGQTTLDRIMPIVCEANISAAVRLANEQDLVLERLEDGLFAFMREWWGLTGAQQYLVVRHLEEQNRRIEAHWAAVEAAKKQSRPLRTAGSAGTRKARKKRKKPARRR